MIRVDWRARAACLDEDPELFFPVGTTRSAMRQRDQAKRVCARCPVTAECLGFALADEIVDGVWGGLSEDQRRSLKLRTVRGPRMSIPLPR